MLGLDSGIAGVCGDGHGGCGAVEVAGGVAVAVAVEAAVAVAMVALFCPALPAHF